MLLDHTAKGVYAIAVTPFKPDGAVDYDSVDRMTDFYLGCGVTGLTILGIMGEAPKLDHAEALAISNRSSAEPGPIIVGSPPRLRSHALLARSVMEGGAAGVMIARRQAFHRRPDRHLLRAQASPPSAPTSRSSFRITPLLTVVMTPKVIQRIVNDNRPVMLKHEDWPGLEKISAARLRERGSAPPHLDSHWQRRPLPRL
jgi:4-hydroxy-tetrahydrodipicolinate synthase